MTKIIQDLEHKAISVDKMLLEFENGKTRDLFSKIKFTGIEEGKDIYNITAPFCDGDKTYIAGRVEARDSEDSQVVFFLKQEDEFALDRDIEPLQLQDPFIAKVQDKWILGGVEIFDDVEKPGQLNYRTIFYQGDSIQNLKPFAKGPDRMKDIRLCDLKDGRILVMTRPQGEVGGRGKIGYTIIHNLEELGIESICQAKLLENQFLPEEWGGCNELHLLSEGKVGILSHVAKYGKEGERHYYSTAFCFNYEEGTYSPMKIIAVRANFAEGPAKREDLEDVIFSGGLLRNNGKAELYCGVSDAEGHKITIEDPFLVFMTM